MSKGVRWTEEQWQAITATGGNLLVAAAAGSGKTAVLVERIINKITDETNPLDLDRLLVVTFTEAAALEMRSRIGSALAKALEQQPGNLHLRKQAALLNKAQISTLHSFCLSVVRRYFFELGLDPQFTVMGANESLLLKQEVLEQVLEEQYANGNENFFRLAEIFGDQGDEALGAQVLRIAEFLAALPFGENWLQEALKYYQAEEPVSLEELPWYRELLRLITLKGELALWHLQRAIQLASRPGGPAAYLEALQEERAGVASFLAACRRQPAWEELRREPPVVFRWLPSIRKNDNVDQDLKEQVASLRDAAKKALQGLEQYFRRTGEELRQELAELGPLLRELVDLVRRYQKAYRQAKEQKGQLDFNDLEHYCLKLLWGPSQVAGELKRQYREIMVDEYQDTNDVQETIIKMLTGEPGTEPQLFMVGDVKQSIYRFRMANPALFLEKYLSYSRGEGSPNRKILLSANFRCRKEIVDGVNHIFRKIMVQSTGELDYDREAELIYRAGYPEAGPEIRLAAGPVELHLIERTGQAEDEEETALEKEGRLIAGRIRELMGEGGNPPAQVWDKEAGCYRPVKYKDMVILLRSTKEKANVLLQVLQEYGLPAYAELGTGYFQAVEVSIMLSLLQLIDNPIQDIPLAAVLRSPLLGLTANDLAAIRAASPGGNYWQAVQRYLAVQPDTPLAGGLKGFLAQLERWRTLARQGPLSRLIWQIYQETAFLEYASAMPGGRQRKANLLALYDRAREFDAFSRHGLFRFLRFIEKLQERDEDLGLAGAFGESDNVIRIMSIHKSKGLEFPVVFVANLGGEFNLKDLNRGVLLHQDLGIASLCYDLKLRVKYPSFAYHAVRNALHRGTLAEELRILYVALTRAREKLILVGTERNLAEARERWQEWGDSCSTLPPPVLATAGCYLDWLGPAVAGDSSPEGKELFRVEYWGLPEGRELPDPGAKASKPNVPLDKIRNLESLGPADPLVQEQLDRVLGWDYPYLAATGQPAKLSVTELKRRLVEQDEEARKLLVSSSITARPRFIQETQGLTGAELGTAMHLVMQHLDLQKVSSKEVIMEQIEQMVEQEFLTPEQAQAVGWKQFLTFFQSPLGQRLIQAAPGQVRREVPFTLSLPAQDIYQDFPAGEGQERVVIQGIIDCLLIEEDGIVVIDYKTDRIRKEDLPGAAAGYRHQLELYGRAVAEIYGLPAKEKYLYFFRLGEYLLISEPLIQY